MAQVGIWGGLLCPGWGSQGAAVPQVGIWECCCAPGGGLEGCALGGDPGELSWPRWGFGGCCAPGGDLGVLLCPRRLCRVLAVLVVELFPRGAQV